MAWELVHDTNWNAQPATPAVAAGQVLADGWIDNAGNVWSVVNSPPTQLFTDIVNGTGFQTTFLYRGIDPAIQNAKVVVDIAAGFGYEQILAIVLRAQGGAFGETAYFFSYAQTQFRIRARVGGAFVQLISNEDLLVNLNNTHDYELTCSAEGVNPTLLEVSFRDKTTDTVIYSKSIGDSRAELQNDDGKSSIALFEGNGGDLPIDRIRTYSSPDGQLDAGPLSVISQIAATTTLGYGGTIGGTEPYTTRLYKSHVSGFTPGVSTLVATNPVFPYAVANDLGQSYYVLIVTDALAATSSTNQLTVNSYAPAYKIGFIGDSITGSAVGGSSPPQAMVYALERFRALSNISAVNQGISGSTSSQWVAGGELLTEALVVFNTNAVEVVSVMLGANDSKISVATTPAQYRANLASMCDALIAAGMTVVINYPSWVTPESGVPVNFDETSVQRLFDYQAQIDDLVNGTTILQGDRLAYTYFGNNQDQLADGLHPNAVGRDSLGLLWAIGNDEAFHPGGGDTPVIVGAPDISAGDLPSVRQQKIQFWLRVCVEATGRTIPPWLKNVSAADLPGVRDQKIFWWLKLLAGQTIP